MSVQRTKQRQSSRTVAPVDTAPAADGPSPLLGQANGWGNVAREASDDCARDERAELALQQRRNGPGE